ncbi:MAG: TrkH family potassium uptake protein [Spirochaeta sp.]
MLVPFSSDNQMTDIWFLFGYFILIAAAGTLLLSLPAATRSGESIPLVDAVFTSVSAVCVTGLITIPTSHFSFFGQTTIMLLIQLGGLGIISFSTVLIILPGLKISLTRLKFVNNYYLSEIEHNPRRIVRAIILGTLTLQTVGTALLYWRFSAHGMPHPFFSALFHTVSAFCNAGFSLYDESLAGFSNSPEVLLFVAVLFILGGISFIVIHETAGRLHAARRRRYVLSLHSQLVLGTTLMLLVLGTISFLVLEWNYSLSSLTVGDKLANAFFQAATPRTAGFNVLQQSDLQPPAILVTMVLMVIGGAPGSIAGGIKVTTFAVMLLVILQGFSNRGNLTIFHREVDSFTIMKAFSFGVKAMAILFGAIFMLSISESSALRAGEISLLEVAFEAVSAFATVGLSLGITEDLSSSSKIIVIFTMFAGRVGLVSLAIPFFSQKANDLVRLPHGEVLLG